MQIKKTKGEKLLEKRIIVYGNTYKSDKHISSRRWSYSRRFLPLAVSLGQDTMVLHSVNCLPTSSYVVYSLVVFYLCSGQLTSPSLLPGQPSLPEIPPLCFPWRPDTLIIWGIAEDVGVCGVAAKCLLKHSSSLKRAKWGKKKKCHHWCCMLLRCQRFCHPFVCKQHFAFIFLLRKSTIHYCMIKF